MDGKDLSRDMQLALTHSVGEGEMLAGMHDLVVHGGVPCGGSVDEG